MIPTTTVGWSRLAGLMVMGFFQQKSEYTKVSYWYLKNFDQSDSWKIDFHCRYGM